MSKRVIDGACAGDLTPRLQGNVDTAPTAIATDTAGATWVGNAACINQLAASGEWVRIDGLRGGLPQYNVTALASGAGVDGMATAVGTLMGLAVFHPSASEYAAATGTPRSRVCARVSVYVAHTSCCRALVDLLQWQSLATDVAKLCVLVRHGRCCGFRFRRRVGGD